MRRVSVDSLRPGMKLAKPVIKDMTTLLGEGTELTDRLIAKIKNLTIADVVIDAPREDGITKETLLRQLDLRFQDRDTEPYMALIKRLVREHIEDIHE
ncbi:MAG TPA: hypothetical protein ENO00_00545 [Deltaproteobacteria bacterium]|nr:hypothetical protein [Deltaproteobacteria bacterium]